MKNRLAIVAVVLVALAGCSTKTNSAVGNGSPTKAFAATAVGIPVKDTNLTVTSVTVTAMCTYKVTLSQAEQAQRQGPVGYTIDNIGPCSPKLSAGQQNSNVVLVAGVLEDSSHWQDDGARSIAQADATFSDGSSHTIYGYTEGTGGDIAGTEWSELTGDFAVSCMQCRNYG